jgi:hypothetical protein
MKILFICGSAEPGKDGVGDYTRRLCGELYKLYHEVQILSLSDQHAVSYTNEMQIIQKTEIRVIRIPKTAANKERFIWSQKILNCFQPDFISLQFVPYSYNPKGLPFWLPFFLKKLQGQHKWHIMFHELWLGINIESSFKHKCIGAVQKIIIKKLIRNIKPQLVNTQNKLYQFFLQSNNISVEVLPICGNIPPKNFKNKVAEYTQFVLFGTIHSGAPFEDFVADLKKIPNTFIKPLKFVFIGRNGSMLNNYTIILENHNIYYEVLGMQSEKIISQALVDSDFGISTTPYYQTEKSGVYAAYREHQINIISVARKWTPTQGQYEIPQIIKYKKNELNLNKVNIEFFDLNSIVMQFIKSISVI